MKHKKILYFSELRIGQHFVWSGEEHVRLPIVATGTLATPGQVNAARIGGEPLLSWFGPNVEVGPVR
jgi:hypothetical protein